jgi:hypothetical protein
MGIFLPVERHDVAKKQSGAVSISIGAAPLLLSLFVVSKKNAKIKSHIDC